MQNVINTPTLTELISAGKEKGHSFNWLRHNHPLLQKDGRPIDLSTLYRWATGKGRKGIALETIRQGGNHISTIEAVNRFFARLDGQELTPAIQQQAKDRAAAAQRNKTWVKQRPAAV